MRVDTYNGTEARHKPHADEQRATKRKRFANGCCGARNLCPDHALIAAKYRAAPSRRAARERRGIKPYAFADERAEELRRLVHDLHGPILPDTAEVRQRVFAIANHLTAEAQRFKY
jgi:hypothetical protein